jgi:diketogulonate reductase-like aldo/keto reductase
MTDQAAAAPLDLHTRLSGGAEIPLVGLGTWQLRGDAAADAVGWALEAGYRHIDTATAYNNENAVGRALDASGLPRDTVFVTTKMPAESRGRERATLDRSLSAMGLDHVDLWLVHWPPGGTSGIDSWREFVRAREDGLARSIGVSNYSFDQIDELTAATDVTPEINQVRWSPSLFDQAMLDGHRERDVVLEGYSPFRAGSLDHPVLLNIANGHQATAAQVVIRWHLQHEIVVIPKSAHRERIVDNVDVAGLVLTEDEMRAIDGIGVMG